MPTGEIFVDSPETTQTEIVNRLKALSDEYRSLDMNAANALSDAADQIRILGIVDLNKPQDWESFEEMQDVAKQWPNKGIFLKGDSNFYLFGVTLYKGQMIYIYGIKSLSETDARQMFLDIKAKRKVG